jgi:excisionase family DNA binding protein
MHKRKEKKPGHEMQQLLLTVAQAAVVLGVHRSTVYDLMKYEGLPRVSLGGRRGTRILLTSLHQWMKERESCSLP